jgi:hypothetical protein
MVSFPLVQYGTKSKVEVDVKCEIVDQDVFDIVKLFGTLNICKITTNYNFIYLSIYVLYHHMVATLLFHDKLLWTCGNKKKKLIKHETYVYISPS